MSALGAAWRLFWHHRADLIRANWRDVTDQWEADTEPGYPLPPFNAAWRDLGMALADCCDAIGGKR